jgi:hypothetical protein
MQVAHLKRSIFGPINTAASSGMRREVFSVGHFRINLGPVDRIGFDLAEVLLEIRVDQVTSQFLNEMIDETDAGNIRRALIEPWDLSC